MSLIPKKKYGDQLLMTLKTCFDDHPLCQKFLLDFKAFLRRYFNSLPVLPFKGHQRLKESIEYSLFSPGKHFRPLLVWATADWTQVPYQQILPWASAIEMAHVASLIHDDLPCMDNSLIRRGRATNHRVFGEDMALLAGNSLWVEPFRLIVTQADPRQAKLWIPILSSALSFNGLMGGQALDIKPPLAKTKLDYYKHMQGMKTGQLICACMEGVVADHFVNQQKKELVKTLAPLIGQAFQVADDLKDAHVEKSSSNVAKGAGYETAQQLLLELSKKALSLLNSIDSSCKNSIESLIILTKHGLYPQEIGKCWTKDINCVF